jgi:hypothetical protein
MTLNPATVKAGSFLVLKTKTKILQLELVTYLVFSQCAYLCLKVYTFTRTIKFRKNPIVVARQQATKFHCSCKYTFKTNLN